MHSLVSIFAIASQIYEGFVHILNFVFWCKSAEISNFSTHKNSHLKVYAKVNVYLSIREVSSFQGVVHMYRLQWSWDLNMCPY